MSNLSFSNLIRTFFILLVSFSIIQSCSSDDDMSPMEEEMEQMDECEGSDPSFSSDVLPILNRSCAISGCHVSGFADGDFSNFAGFSARASTALSRMSSGSMPPSSSSGPDPSNAQILIIRCWIEAGAKDN